MTEPALKAPPPAAAATPSTDVVVIDSIGAWRMLPAVCRWRRRVPFVAIVHQCPGGTDGAAAWRRIKARLDLAVYRRCRASIAASGTLRDALVDGGLPPSSVTVIEPGCDLPLAAEAPERMSAFR